MRRLQSYGTLIEAWGVVPREPSGQLETTRIERALAYYNWVVSFEHSGKGEGADTNWWSAVAAKGSFMQYHVNTLLQLGQLDERELHCRLSVRFRHAIGNGQTLGIV